MIRFFIRRATVIDRFRTPGRQRILVYEGEAIPLRPVVDQSRHNRTHLVPCEKCGRLGTHGELTEGVCSSCRRDSRAGTDVSTSACRGCGMRFSANLMEDGLCNNCRDHDDECETEQRKTGKTGGSPERVHLRHAYETMGCEATETDESIKRRRRELVKDCHADSLPQGLPLDRIREANQRFCAIQEAYETIMEERKNRS